MVVESELFVLEVMRNFVGWKERSRVNNAESYPSDILLLQEKKEKKS